MKNTTTPEEALAATRRNHARADYNLWRAGLRARAASALVVGPRSGITYRIVGGSSAHEGTLTRRDCALFLHPLALTNSLSELTARSGRALLNLFPEPRKA